MSGWRRMTKACAVAVSLALAGAAQAQDLPKTQLKVVGNLGITTQSAQLERPFWNEKIPAKSNGSITAEFKPWNELGLKGPEVFRLLQQGLYDLATAQLGHMAGDAPINDATDLAGLSPEIETYRKVTEAFRPVLTQWYADNFNLKVLGLWSFQPQILYCRDELKGLKDLKGRKVRTSGASQADFIEHFGGAGINLAFGEVQQALARGVIDCSITGTLGGYSAKWYEAAKYLYPLPINWGASINAANAASWQRLDPSVQQFLAANIEELEDAAWELNRREIEMGIQCNTGGDCPLGKPADMKLLPVSAEDLELRRQALLETVLPRWAERCGADCAAKWNDTIGKVVDLQVPAK